MIASIIISTVVPIVLASFVWTYSASKETDPQQEKLINQRIQEFCPNNKEYIGTTSKYNLGFLQSGVIGFMSGAFIG